MADFPILFLMIAPQGRVKESVMFSALMESGLVTRDKGIEIGGGSREVIHLNDYFSTELLI